MKTTQELDEIVKEVKRLFNNEKKVLPVLSNKDWNAAVNRYEEYEKAAYAAVNGLDDDDFYYVEHRLCDDLGWLTFSELGEYELLGC